MTDSGAQVAVVRAKLKFATREQFIAGFTPLVSRAGLFIRTKNSKAEDTTVRFEFRLADDTVVFVGEGVVRKQIPFDETNPSKPCGMLVGLKRLNKVSKDVLAEILARKEGRTAPSQEQTKPRIEAPKPPEPEITPPAQPAVSDADHATPADPVAAALLDPTGPIPSLQAQPEPEPEPQPEPEPEPPAVLEPTPPGPSPAMQADAALPQTELGMEPEPEPQPEPEPEPEPAPVAPADSIFGGDDDDDNLFGGGDDEFDLFGELDGGLDDLFAGAGMTSDTDFSVGVPVDMMGSALPMVNVGNIFEEEEEGGELLAFDESDLEDDEDDEDLFGDFEASAEAEPEPEPEPEPTPQATPDREAMLFTEPDPVEPESHELPAIDLSAPDEDVHVPASMPNLPGEPTVGPQEHEDLSELLHSLDTNEPVTPREESGLLHTPSILSEPRIDQEAMEKRAAMPGHAGRPAIPKPSAAIPPPPSRLPPPPLPDQNPLDNVSISNADLPPPPKPKGFTTPSLNDLESDKPAKKGLFNKLFGKE